MSQGTKETIRAMAGSKHGPTGSQIVGLDFLRLFAACVVMVYHFGFWHLTIAAQTLYAKVPAGIGQSIQPFTHFEWVGVEIFFLISGYVISLSAANATPYDFMRSRVLRLVPAVWICAPLAFILYLVFIHQALSDLVPELIRTLIFFPMFKAIDGVYWTLGIEIFFYGLIWALIRMQKAAWIDRLPLILGTISLGFWLFYFAGMSVLSDGTLKSLFNRAIAFRPFQLLLFQHGCFFGLGILIRIWQERGMTAQRLCVFAGLVLGCWLEIIAQNGIIERSAQLPLPAWPAICLWTAGLVFCGLMIRYNAVMLTVFDRHLSAIRRMGLMTYPLYLSHVSIGLTVIVIFMPYIGVLNSIPLGILAGLISAYLISKFGEPVVKRLLAKALPSRSVAEVTLTIIPPTKST